MLDLIPFMMLVEDVSAILGIEYSTPEVQYKKIRPKTITDVYENNRRALELANFPKLWPCTKHIALKYHHFREHVRNGWVLIHAIDTREQLEYVFMKALPRDAFQYLYVTRYVDGETLITSHQGVWEKYTSAWCCLYHITCSTTCYTFIIIFCHALCAHWCFDSYISFTTISNLWYKDNFLLNW